MTDAAADLKALLLATVPDTKTIVQPWVWTCPTGAGYTLFHANRPCYLEPLTPATAGTCYWAPNANPSGDTLAFSGALPYLFATGDWFVRTSSGAPENFRVIDGGSAGNAMAIASAVGASGINLIQISGTPQTPLDLTGKFAPRVLAGNDPDNVAVDDDNTVIRIPALVGRKFLYIRNIGLNAVGLAFASGKADPTKGIILNPDEVLPADALDGITEEDIYAACDAAEVSTLAFQQGV